MTMALVSFLLFVGFGFFIYFQAKRKHALLNEKLTELKVVDSKLAEQQKNAEQSVNDVKVQMELVKKEQENKTPEQIQDFWKKN
jgi:predicted nuclease with TOPRIM domain